MYLFTCVVILLLISTATEAILCYNCTNFRDRKKYCQTGEIHHMDKIKCKGKHCLYYDLNKVFINKKIVKRSCLQTKDECMQIRDTPGNDLNQCVICSWDLCNESPRSISSDFVLVACSVVTILRLFQ